MQRQFAVAANALRRVAPLARRDAQPHVAPRAPHPSAKELAASRRTIGEPAKPSPKIQEKNDEIELLNRINRPLRRRRGGERAAER